MDSHVAGVFQVDLLGHGRSTHLGGGNARRGQGLKPQLHGLKKKKVEG